MSGFGWQTFDANGTILVDVTNRLPSVFGVFPYSILAGSTSPLVISTPGTDDLGGFYALGLQDIMNPIVGNNIVTINFYVGTPTQAFSGNVTVFEL